jgi:glycosyltransferase involved in cell wall biosynthesis
VKVAWLGPAPTDGGGVPYVATLLLQGLAAHDTQVDCFVAGDMRAIPERLRAEKAINFVTRHQRWEWDRWYSGARAGALGQVTEQATRAWAQRNLVREMAKRHRAQPYDVLYQFSQWELLGARKRRGDLPPIVLHPQVHAAGELRWHVREARLARRTEPRVQTAAVRAILRGRARFQRRDAQLADLIIAASPQFAGDIARDYRVEEERIAIVPNPVDVARFEPGTGSRRDPDKPLTLLFVSRFSVRKGVEMIVELSHRLHDLAGQVRIVVVGYPSPWSNYERLLEGLNPAVGVLHGWAEPEDLPGIYQEADALLQPSHYEPFGLCVAEALASGLPVVASDCVGATAAVDETCLRTFASGSTEGFEHAVRALLRSLGTDAPRLRLAARHEAERLFDPVVVGNQLRSALASVTRDGG